MDPISGNIYVREMYAPQPSKKGKDEKNAKKEDEEEEGDEEEGGEEEEETEEKDEFFAQLAGDVIERLVVRPEDTQAQVDNSLKTYKEALLHALEDQMASMDQSFLLEIDSNLSPTILIKQLLLRLQCYKVSKAAKPLRMSDPVEVNEGEEEGAEDAAGAGADNFMDKGELDEAFMGLQLKKRIGGGKFKWRRSKCSFYCPVSLKDGRIALGKPDYAAAFLDKLYMMADENALRTFLKNPRPFIKAPQPRAPCKLSILGPKYAGKTTLAGLLAKKYNAHVIDMQSLMEPKLNEARDELISRTRTETAQTTIENLKTKYREKIESDKLKKEQELAEKAAAAAGEEDIPEGDEEKAQNAEQGDSSSAAEPAKEEEASESDKFVRMNEEGEVVVDPDHPEIEQAVERAVQDVMRQNINLPAIEYVKVLRGELDKLRAERSKLDPTAPNDGGWILDNFPTDADQFNVMVESNIIPDTFVLLQDSSEDSGILTKRWYNANRESIDLRIATRLAEEEAQRAEEARREAESRKVAEIDIKIDGDETDEQKKEEDASSAVPAPTVDGDDERLETIVEETHPPVAEASSSNIENQVVKEPVVKTQEDGSTSSEEKDKTLSTSVRPATPVIQELPVKGPETQEFTSLVRSYFDSLRGLIGAVINMTGSDPINLDIYKPTTETENVVVGRSLDEDTKTLDQCVSESSEAMERVFKFTAQDFEGGEEEEQGDDEEEEEEDQDNYAEDEDEEEEDEEEDEDKVFDPSVKEKNVSFGETGHYCPVMLQQQFILMPGNPEIQAKYRERYYRFSSEEARTAFIETPDVYLPTNTKRIQVPPPRILVLGPRGSGKSTQARYLADQLNIFHVKFRDYLQELVIGKTKKKLEAEHEEEKALDDQMQLEIEEEQLEEEQERENEKKNDSLPEPEVKKEEEPPVELTEKEEIIKGYLERDEQLPNEIIDEIVAKLWNEEPFRSRGFVLDDFPSNDAQAQYLIEKNFFPDATIYLNMEDDDIVKRLLPPRLQIWKDKMKAKKDKRKQRAEKKKAKLMKKMKERRDEEIAKYEERRRRIEEEAAENGEEPEEEEEFDVDAIIQEEFADQLQEEEEEDADEMQEDEVRESIIADIRANYETQAGMIDSVKEILQEAFIPRYVIEANRKPNIVRYLIKKRLTRFIQYRQSLLERVYPVKLKTANKLVDFGYKRLSRFGRWCPVKLMENEPVQQLYDDKKRPYPVIHRSYVYYLSSKEARRKFILDPLSFLKQPSPLTTVPIRFAILGPPKSGKTTLCNRFVKQYGCVRLSVGEAIRAVLKNQPNTELAETIQSYLIKGKTVPDELAIQCIEVCILDVKCQLHGYVLDNYPVTKQQVALMNSRGLIPVKVIELKCEVKEIMHRCIRDRTNLKQPASTGSSAKSNQQTQNVIIMNDSPEAIAYKLKEWKNEFGFIRDWYANEHKNLIALDGHQSKWHLWEQVKNIAFDSVRVIQVYLDRVNSHQAASIADLCVTYNEMASRLSDFGQYCPVSLALYNELVDCSEARHMNFVAEYQGYYYKMFSAKELDLFLATPEKFVPPQAPRKLPPANLLPKKRSATEVKELFPKPVELKGFCAVTYYDGKQRYEALEEGYPEFAVEYKGKLYFTTCRETQDKFMRKPELYSSLQLPHKLPPVKKQLNLFELPMTGYLEQTVADLIKKALTAVGNAKPKFPFLSANKSALLYVAYYLKAYNTRSSEYRRKKYKQKLIYFEEKCQLIDFIHSQSTLKYREPSKRSDEFNLKLENFFSLKENTPTMNWLS